MHVESKQRKRKRIDTAETDPQSNSAREAKTGHFDLASHQRRDTVAEGGLGSGELSSQLSPNLRDVIMASTASLPHPMQNSLLSTPNILTHPLYGFGLSGESAMSILGINRGANIETLQNLGLLNALPALQRESLLLELQQQQRRRLLLAGAATSMLSSTNRNRLMEQEQLRQSWSGVADALVMNRIQALGHLSQRSGQGLRYNDILPGVSSRNAIQSSRPSLQQMLQPRTGRGIASSDTPSIASTSNQFNLDALRNLVFGNSTSQAASREALTLVGTTTSDPPVSLGQPRPPRSISLATDKDDEKLSEYQILVRQQLEVFVADREDVASSMQGRKKHVYPGQVGLRCCHCAHIPSRERGKGAIYFPSKLESIYQAAQNMASSHLCESCECIDGTIRERLQSLRQRRDTASGGKAYWADSCRKLGVYETEKGLRLRGW